MHLPLPFLVMIACCGAAPGAVAQNDFTGFENAVAGPLTRATFDGATWTAPEGHARILDRMARDGRHCLQLTGGEHSELVIELTGERAETEYGLLTFAAERWTRRDPFRFRVAAAPADGGWREVFDGDRSLQVGRAYLNQVQVPLPEGTRRLRLSCTSPPDTGVLIDDLALVEAGPMRVTRVSVRPRTAPVLIGEQDSVLLQVVVDTQGVRPPCHVTGALFAVEEGADLIREVRFLDCAPARPAGQLIFANRQALEPGLNVFDLSCQLTGDARLDAHVTVRCRRVLIDERDPLAPEDGELTVRSRVGVALRRRGQDSVHTYRIPGLTTTNDGTLIAVYDHRNRDGSDLPGDIDVGMSRSTDGGRTWSPGRVILDMGDDPAWRYDGVGDPSILTDRVTGAVWVAATWSHGDRSWNGSGPGLTPEETGQLMLVHSDDDGRTWSEPINITRQAKTNPRWRFVLASPGRGITMRDGTLVFPAQYRGVNEAPVNGKPFSTILVSQDRGETWRLGTGVKIDTTESQVVQLGDGSLMLNCRDNRGGARSVFTTTDRGETWTEHPSSRQALPEPVCNAGLLRVEHPTHGALLFFSNPDTTQGRHTMTLKVSRDEGETWPAKWHTLYDERPGNGYSIVSPVGEDHVGVLYEGRGELYFVRYSIEELLTGRR